mgnify:FL=1
MKFLGNHQSKGYLLVANNKVLSHEGCWYDIYKMSLPSILQWCEFESIEDVKEMAKGCDIHKYEIVKVSSLFNLEVIEV